jgi:hypothetical protein
VSKLDDRVTKLERDMGNMRRDVEAARALASGAYQDVVDMRAELRAHTKTLEALHVNQVELRKDYKALREDHNELHREVDEGFTVMREGFAEVDRRFVGLESEMREGFTKIGLGMAQITALLNIAINKDETGG